MSTSSPTPDSTASLRPPGARKSAPSVSAIQVGADGSGKGWLAVIAKRTWTVARGHCHLAPQQVPLVDEPIYDEGRAVLVHDADVILNRAKADVMVDGHVYPPGGRTPFDFQVQVGTLLRRARAFGPRRASAGIAGAAGPHISLPEPVDKISLGWESAYGGVDLNVAIAARS